LYYDDSTRTVNINLLDAITDTEDWSDYYISHNTDYNTGVSTDNYIKFTEVNEFKDYNDKNPEGFGGINISTQNKNQKSKNLYEVPFAPVVEQFSPKSPVQTMYIDYYGYEKDEKRIVITSVADNGSGLCRISCANSFRVDDVVSVEGKVYNQYARVSVATATYIDVGIAFVSTDTGNVYQVNVSKNDGQQNRIGIVLPGYNVSDVSLSGSNVRVRYVNSSGLLSEYTSSTAPIVVFDKPAYGTSASAGLNIDAVKQSLALESINGNVSLGNIYYKKIKNIIASPRVRAKMLLPLNAFRNFKFDRNIYLNTERLSGAFFVETIKDYKDSVTPVEVTLYKL
jgi:hypothetical protein